ncbi:sel1 repeat family protein, partial [Rhodopirellula sp.]|nr:sel1 repeat family protein [Rhodopirellula sp.]
MWYLPLGWHSNPSFNIEESVIPIKAITICFAVAAIVGCGSGTKSAPQTQYEQLLEHANAGEAAAQAALANAYRVGHAGVQQDYVEAAKWYRKAAEQGNASAQAVLGHLYRTGEGVQQDYAEAFIWDRRAAEQDIATAQRVVGHAYRVGSGVQQDSVEAFAWFSVAANSGDEGAIQTRDQIKTMIDPKLLGQAESLAAEYIQRFGRGKLAHVGNKSLPALPDFNLPANSSADSVPEKQPSVGEKNAVHDQPSRPAKDAFDSMMEKMKRASAVDEETPQGQNNLANKLNGDIVRLQSQGGTARNEIEKLKVAAAKWREKS